MNSLRKAVTLSARFAEFAQTDTLFDNIRHRPEFQELLVDRSGD